MVIDNKDDATHEAPEMSPAPPFDPPYLTQVHTAKGPQLIETKADGSTRIVAESEIPGYRHPAHRHGKPAMESNQRTVQSANIPNQRFTPLANGNDRAVMFLEVPFAEKDKAKALGAKWDVAMRKWFVPHGIDVNLFSRWWPETLKQEMKVFGQL